MNGPDMPVWSPDDHLSRVYRRGRQLRRRRRALIAGVPVIAAAVALALVVVPGSSGSSRRSPGFRALAAPPAATPGTRPNEATSVGPANTEPPPVVTSSPGGRNAAGSRGEPSSRRTPRATGSTTSTTLREPGTVTTITVPAISRAAVRTCAASDLAWSTATNSLSYSRGERITITIVARNTSSGACQAPSACGVSSWAEVADSDGALVWHSNPVSKSCTNKPAPPPQLAPGQSATYRTSSAWNQRICPGQGNCPNVQAPAGGYRAVAHRGDVTASPASFTLAG